MRRLPLIAPNPPRLSELGDALRRVEASGVFTNNGPELRRFEQDATERLFGGRGASLALANATLGLMVAIRHAMGSSRDTGRLALMPALTFAATAQAAEWAGLCPLVADIDPDDWGMAAAEEERLLAAHKGRIAVIVPYATFGNAIDLDRYAWLARTHEVGVVIDAASSLGTQDEAGLGWGAEAPFPVVFSMHATKTFAVAEGALIHSGDVRLIETLRSIASFGFEAPRTASLPGLNAKLPEVLAVMAQAKLEDFDAVCANRHVLETAYRDSLPGFRLQRVYGARRAIQFMGAMLPRKDAHRRDAIVEQLAAKGIGVGKYFSPHLGEQPWFRAHALIEPTPVADEVAARMLSLPVTDAMTAEDARFISAALVEACGRTMPAAPVAIASTLVVGGGPAGTALLTAASKRGLLPEFARGLVMVDREAGIGRGRLAGYAINSDSTAETFLSAVKDNAHPEIAALAGHPIGRAIAAHVGGMGVPLYETGALIRATAERLGAIVEANGGTLLTGHEALGSRRVGSGLWSTRLRRLSDGHESERLSRNLVIATGGYQPVERLAAQEVAGAPLLAMAGDRLVQSDEVLALGGLQKVADRLAGRRAPKVVVIGGSTSALSAVALLLRSRNPGLPFGAGGLALLHRRPLRPFYPSVEAAHAEDFTDFGPDDICPVSGFVYRLAGFRLEARELVLRMLGVDGRAPDPRVRLHRLGDDDAAARALIEDADLVIAAMGYRPHALPLADSQGRPIHLAAEMGAAMVDRHCRVVDAGGMPVPGVYGIGLAAGFVPWGKLGGERSFVGQANGLWLWQNDIGLMIVDQVLGAEGARAVA